MDSTIVRERALVAFATKHGSTAGIAEAIGEALRSHGLEVDVRPAREVRTIDAYGPVILGSAVYMFRWQGDAVDFLKRFRRELPAHPMWLFSSGPIGGDAKAEVKLQEVLAEQPEISGNARGLAAKIGVRGHRTFGGRAGDEMNGVFERWVPKGDWRDFDEVRSWAASIAQSVSVPAV